ncbi:MAG: SCO family protein [Acidobacteriota bacterium]
MARITQALVLVLSIAVAGNAQMKSASDVGIDEKLGLKVALDTVLKDEDGKDITLRQLIDKPTILLFNYFRCPGICPVLISNMVHVVNQMNLNPGKDYRLIAVSFDPTDTPEKAREKKANYLNQMKRPFSPEDWHFLTGTAENTRTVADSTGFNYHPQGDMYVHPGAIIALTPKGVISRYLYGTSFLPADVEIAIQEAAGGQVLPTVSRVLSFCYVSDPEGRGRVFSVTRFAGAATLFIAAVFLVFVLRGKSRRKAKDLHT